MDFYHNLTTPVVALAPMDGVTDSAYRQIQKRYGGPELLFTEFTNVIGLSRGIERLFADLQYDQEERPIIAQLFGDSPEHFHTAAKIVAALGFDGVDINMGCPARNIAERGCGAGLIKKPKLAKDIIRATKRGIKDYFENPVQKNLSPQVKQLIDRANNQRGEKIDRKKQERNFTLSIKTRIGYDQNTVGEWMKHLTEVGPNWISIHGRTLKQLYKGNADWDAIAEAVESTHIPILANGDIKTPDNAVKILNHTKAAGVLIGRASYGNPWIFKSISEIKNGNLPITPISPSWNEIKKVMKEHTLLHLGNKGNKAFVQMRKNLGWYAREFPGAATLRNKLVRVSSIEELEKILKKQR